MRKMLFVFTLMIGMLFISNLALANDPLPNDEPEFTADSERGQGNGNGPFLRDIMPGRNNPLFPLVPIQRRDPHDGGDIPFIGFV